MRQPLPEWMTPTDRAILERLLNEGNDELILAPRPIADNTDFARSTVRTHLVKLREESMVEYVDEEGGVHRLTERGRAFAKGDTDPEGLSYEEQSER